MANVQVLEMNVRFGEIKMKKFDKSEIKSIFWILIFLMLISTYNFSVSLRRGRDSIRKNDISSIQKSLDIYYQKYKIYPSSSASGSIIGCFEKGALVDFKTGYPNNQIECKWGESRFESDNFMPRDPNYEKGVNYFYISDGKNYEIYIALEGKDEDEFTQSDYDKNLQCGTKICNYGRRSNSI